MSNLLPNLRLAIEDLEISLGLSYLLEQELEFTTERFEKEIETNQLNIQEYQHKWRFISELYTKQLEEMQLRVNKIKELIENNN